MTTHLASASKLLSQKCHKGTINFQISFHLQNYLRGNRTASIYSWRAHFVSAHFSTPKSKANLAFTPSFLLYSSVAPFWSVQHLTRGKSFLQHSGTSPLTCTNQTSTNIVTNPLLPEFVPWNLLSESSKPWHTDNQCNHRNSNYERKHWCWGQFLHHKKKLHDFLNR